MPEECAAEMSATGQPAHNLLAPNSKLTIGEIMDYQGYSTMLRLLRTAYVLRAMRRFKNSSSTHNHSTAQTTEELVDAERLCIIHVQVQLNCAKCLSTWQRQLDLFIDGKGLWRCDGRLANADIQYQASSVTSTRSSVDIYDCPRGTKSCKAQPESRRP